jgi:hypothetical protein
MMTVRLSAPSIHVAHTLEGLRERAFQVFHRLQQGICALQGHNPLLHFETNRLSLRCANCGWHTPGWNIDGRSDARASLARRSWGTAGSLPHTGCHRRYGLDEPIHE